MIMWSPPRELIEIVLRSLLPPEQGPDRAITGRNGELICANVVANNVAIPAGEPIGQSTSMQCSLVPLYVPPPATPPYWSPLLGVESGGGASCVPLVL
jgi:hypothetical protein